MKGVGLIIQEQGQWGTYSGDLSVLHNSICQGKRQHYLHFEGRHVSVDCYIFHGV